MRALVLILAAALVAPLPAAAQAWKRFAYGEAGFAVQLPKEPTKTEGTYRLGAQSAPAATWTLKDDGIVYSMTVADFSKAKLEKDAALDAAVKALSAQGEIKVDVTERIDREFGRQISLAGKDGSRSTLSIFLVNGRLYQQEAKALPPDPQASSAKAARFQQSLEFIGLGAEAFRPENRAPGGFAPGRGFARLAGPPPQAFAACQGKAPGDRLELATPRGMVAATCAAAPRGLFARPDRPPPGAPPPA